MTDRMYACRLTWLFRREWHYEMKDERRLITEDHLIKA